MINSALLTDYYQLTMAYGFWRSGIHEQQAVFHLFCRKTPVFSEYLVASGLTQTIQFLQNFQFSDEDIAYLQSFFPNDFLSYLKTLRFTGDIDAVSDGNLLFAHEPFLRVKAPLIQAQLLETVLINTHCFASNVATMASQMRQVVGYDDLLFEFGLRRAQGPDGGLTASRSAFLGGFDATSNVLAGKQFDIPVVGTMSHSWVMAFDNEITAFRHCAEMMPEHAVLLVDTFNTEQGVKNAITVGLELRQKGHDLKGIRLDSGDLAQLSCRARQLLDESGFAATKIYISGELSLEKMRTIKEASAPVDGWGVGTRLSTAYEQPALDMAYKLGAILDNGQWHYKLKESENRVKTSDPGILQIKRHCQRERWVGDVIYHSEAGLFEDIYPNTNQYDLLSPIFRSGQLVYKAPSLSDTKVYCQQQVRAFLNSGGPKCYPVHRDMYLQTLKKALINELFE